MINCILGVKKKEFSWTNKLCVHMLFCCLIDRHWIYWSVTIEILHFLFRNSKKNWIFCEIIRLFVGFFSILSDKINIFVTAPSLQLHARTNSEQIWLNYVYRYDKWHSFPQNHKANITTSVCLRVYNRFAGQIGVIAKKILWKKNVDNFQWIAIFMWKDNQIH